MPNDPVTQTDETGRPLLRYEQRQLLGKRIAKAQSEGHNATAQQP